MRRWRLKEFTPAPGYEDFKPPETIVTGEVDPRTSPQSRALLERDVEPVTPLSLLNRANDSLLGEYMELLEVMERILTRVERVEMRLAFQEFDQWSYDSEYQDDGLRLRDVDSLIAFSLREALEDGD
jgi:hypothetical protein